MSGEGKLDKMKVIIRIETETRRKVGRISSSQVSYITLVYNVCCDFKKGFCGKIILSTLHNIFFFFWGNIYLHVIGSEKSHKEKKSCLNYCCQNLFNHEIYYVGNIYKDPKRLALFRTYID